MASILNADKATVCGGLYRVWCLADQYTEDGRLVGYTPAILDGNVGIGGLSDAMLQVGWLEIQGDTLIFPRFDEHNGQTAKRRAQERERMRRVRNSFASDANKKRTREEGEAEGEQTEEDPAPSDLDGARSVSEEKRGEVFHLVERIAKVVPCRCSNDWPLVAKVALLVTAGRLSENDLEESLEHIRLKKPKNPASRFHKCLTNKAGDIGQNFNAMLASIKEIPRWLHKPGAE